MPDRESAITHLMIISTWASFARERDLQFFTRKHLESMEAWADEAITLLKEQETAILYKCSNCGTWVSAENVVRCKDCKWYDERISMCENCGLPREQTFFCADGKRR